MTGEASHRYGSWRWPPGSWMLWRALKESIKTLRCFSRFPGSPNMLPRGNRTWSHLGGLTRVVTWGLFERETVEIPQASISRCTSPPDWWQTGQTGITRATSTPSATIFSAMAGAVCSARSAAIGA